MNQQQVRGVALHRAYLLVEEAVMQSPEWVDEYTHAEELQIRAELDRIAQRLWDQSEKIWARQPQPVAAP